MIGRYLCRVGVGGLFFALLVCAGQSPVTAAQGLGGVGIVQGTITDPTGGPMQAVEIRLSNPVSGLTRTVTTDAMGRFVFSNLPPNPYHLSIEVQGFKTAERDVEVRSGVPIESSFKLELGLTETVSVVGHSEDLL